MDRIELQRLRDLPIEGVAERLGMAVARHKALCPFHDDHHASLSFNVRRNTFRCFACDAHGGTIDLVMRVKGMEFREACGWLGLTPDPSPEREGRKVLSGVKFQVSSGLTPQPPLQKGEGETAHVFDASRYSRFFDHPYLSPAARRFLFEERRLDERVVRWCRLTSWRDRNGVEWLQIPYYDTKGKLVGIQNRNLGLTPRPPLQQGEGEKCLTPSPSPEGEGSGNPKILRPSPHGEGTGVRQLTGVRQTRFRFPKGSQCGIYNLPVLQRLRRGEALYITEGCSDCWAMLSSGHKAIAIPSATLLSKKDKELLETLYMRHDTAFHMFPDRDAPGERLFLQLQQVLPDLQHHQLPLDCKDYSDYYLRNLKLET